MRQYQTFRDLDMRLNGCVIEIDGEIGLVSDVAYRDSENNAAHTDDETGKNCIYFRTMRPDGLKRAKVLEIDDKIIKPMSRKLGFVNLVNEPEGFVFLERNCRRNYKDGWYSRNIHVHLFSHNARWDDLTRNGSLLSLINNEYPEIEEALDKKRAFHRNFAFTDLGSKISTGVLYKKTQVGEFLASQKKFFLNEEYSFLKEQLYRALNGQTEEEINVLQ